MYSLDNCNHNEDIGLKCTHEAEPDAKQFAPRTFSEQIIQRRKHNVLDNGLVKLADDKGNAITCNYRKRAYFRSANRLDALLLRYLFVSQSPPCSNLKTM